MTLEMDNILQGSIINWWLTQKSTNEEAQIYNMIQCSVAGKNRLFHYLYQLCYKSDLHKLRWNAKPKFYFIYH